MIPMPSERKTASKLEVNLASRSRISALAGWARSPSVQANWRACWVTQGTPGAGRHPGDVQLPGVVLDEKEHVEPTEEHGVHREEVAGQEG